MRNVVTPRECLARARRLREMALATAERESRQSPIVAEERHEFLLVAEEYERLAEAIEAE